MNNIKNFQNYLTSERRLSAHTVLAYVNDIHQFENFLQVTYSGIEWKLLTHHHIRSWVVDCTHKKISAKSVNRKISSLKSFFKYLRRGGFVDKDPTQKIQSLRKGKRLPNVINEAAAVNLLHTMEGNDGFEGIRDKLLLELLYQTGMRRAEVISLRDIDVHFGKGSLKVTGKGDKQRIIPISKSLMELIKSYILARDDLFQNRENENTLLLTNKGKSMYPKFVYNRVHHYLKSIPNTQKRSPHVLRHSFATHLSDHGADLNAIKEILGHSSLAATQIYTHNAIDKLKKAYRQAHPNS